MKIQKHSDIIFLLLLWVMMMFDKEAKTFETKNVRIRKTIDESINVMDVSKKNWIKIFENQFLIWIFSIILVKVKEMIIFFFNSILDISQPRKKIAHRIMRIFFSRMCSVFLFPSFVWWTFFQDDDYIEEHSFFLLLHLNANWFKNNYPTIHPSIHPSSNDNHHHHPNRECVHVERISNERKWKSPIPLFIHPSLIQITKMFLNVENIEFCYFDKM